MLHVATIENGSRTGAKRLGALQGLLQRGSENRLSAAFALQEAPVRVTIEWLRKNRQVAAWCLASELNP